MNEPVTGEEWSITVLSAKNVGTKLDTGAFNVTANEPNTHFLLVKANVKHLTGEPIGASFCRKDILVRDSGGNSYPLLGALVLNGMFPLVCFEQQDPANLVQEVEAVIDPFFIVPDNVQIVELIWVDLAPVRLEIQ